MKWKIDYPYVVCIVFLIGAGIWMNYLSIKKQGLEKEVEWFRQETERLGQFYQQVTDLYFTGLQVVTIDPGQGTRKKAKYLIIQYLAFSFA